MASNNLKFKKTTITGQAAGIAKRLESQAKKIRQKSNSKSFPIILMDESLFSTAKTLNAFQKHDFSKLKGTEKNIENKSCYSWQFTSE